MLKYQTQNSKETFGKKIPRFNLNPYIRKFKLDPLEVEVLLELDYQHRIYNPLVTSFQELSAFLCRTEKSVKRAMEELERYGLISMKTVRHGKGTYKIITFLVDLLKTTEKSLTEEVQMYEHKIASMRTRKISAEEEKEIEESEVFPKEIPVQEENLSVNSQLISNGLVTDPETGEPVHNPSKGIYNGFEL